MKLSVHDALYYRHAIGDQWRRRGPGAITGERVTTMRNLLGRLHARPPAELERIAAFWHVPIAGDSHARVAGLYRGLNDMRSVRAVWDRLATDEQAMVRLLAINEATDTAPTVAELAAHLHTPTTAARETAVRLYRAGILAREGDDDPLPVGASPRLILPRELAFHFRRVQDEIEAGDLSSTPLRALLALLDDTEIEAAAALWGLRVVPGLRRRDDLTGRLLRQVADPERGEKVAADRKGDAARLWRRVRDAPDGAPVLLSEAAADARLGGGDPGTGQRLRAALADLEAALLVWHTYRPDGSRWLFIPAEIRTPRPVAATALPPLAPVTEATIAHSPWRHQDALAWDLLTLLREIADPDTPPWPAETDPPRGRLRRLNRRLWHRGAEIPPPGYLDTLCALALAEGLLHQDGDDHHATLTLAAAARAWRERSFAAQTERLRWWWLASDDWIEGRSRGEVEVWGADWRGARRKLLTLLGDPAIGLEPAVWYALESVAVRIAAHDPDLLGPTFTAATARRAAEGEDESRRTAAITEVVSIELLTAFSWFGLVEPADVSGHTRAVRLTAAGLGLGRGDTGLQHDNQPPGNDDDPAVHVSPEGIIALRAPTPLRVWALSAFAEPEQLARVSRYRLTAGALERALAAGFDLDQVVAFFTRQSGAALPDPVASLLDEWVRGYGRIRLQRAIVLSPDQPGALAEVQRLVDDAGMAVRVLDDDALLITLSPTAGDANAEDAVLALLRGSGYSPNWGKPRR